MLTVALALALAGADPPCPEPFALGPSDAPAIVDAYLDPAEPGAWTTVLELRRLVADDAGRTRVVLYLARSSGPTDPARDRVRAWAAALAHHERLLPALAQVARDGADRVGARLGTVEGRAALARDVDLAPALHERLAADRCAARSIDDATAALPVRVDAGGAFTRLPTFVVGEAILDDGPSLERLRPELGRPAARPDDAAAPVPIVPPPASTAMKRPALRGLLLGGVGLPHRLVVQARDEEDTALVLLLPLALEHRREQPGTLAVHIVARGSTFASETLRHRLCAARLVGRGTAYAEVLASDPAARQAPPPDVQALLLALDAVPEGRCAREPDPAELDLPDGAWLDGLPRSRAELVDLDATLAVLDVLRRPLSAVLTPPRAEE